MSNTNKAERMALAAMAVMAAVSLLAVIQGYVALGFLLFAGAATPLPLLASIRARRTQQSDPQPPRRHQAR
ncbi:MAG TPA: hypothetical protein VLR71_12975 [Casimicrobiaceae bacterium]|nr:hypothetical protein [Casimicrobiaceae bacterium]